MSGRHALALAQPLEKNTQAGFTLLSTGLSDSAQRELIYAYQHNTLASFLNALDNHQFLAILVDEKEDAVIALNDKFGSNDIFYTTDKETRWITDDIFLLTELRGVIPTIDTDAAYEHLTFYTVCPPRTLYQNIHAVPMGSYARFVGGNEPEIVLYWELAERLSVKKHVYGDILADFNQALLDSLRKDLDRKTAVALSGGIDSGGLLGMCKHLRGKAPISFSIGPHGPSSSDLASAKETAQELGSENRQLFPSVAQLKSLPSIFARLSQPILADIALPNAQLCENAAKENCRQMVFGFGSEMLLGNLKYGKIAYHLKHIERFAPKTVLAGFARLAARAGLISKNQEDFVCARSWSARFLRVRAPLLGREQQLYRKLSKSFLPTMEQYLEKLVPSQGKDFGDQAVRLYLQTWENYLQRRDINHVAQKYAVTPIIPFDTPEVAQALFATPTAFRKRNNWDKQLIRDVFAPYISHRLQVRRGKSLVVPYTKLLAPHRETLMTYLRTSPLLSELIDLDAFANTYEQLPEPGLSLIRFVGLAVWYDVNWHTQNVPALEKMLGKLE